MPAPVLCARSSCEVLAMWLEYKSSLSPTERIILGIAMILLGIYIPGESNWLVGSARDSNCFSEMADLISLIANLCQLGFVLSGSIIVAHGFIFRDRTNAWLCSKILLSPTKRIVLGIVMILIGIYISGACNQLICGGSLCELFRFSIAR